MAEREDQIPHAGPRGAPPPRAPEHDGDLQCVEWCPVCRTADLLRETASPELRDQLHRIQREALLTMRTLIDHYLERLDETEADTGPRVEDIPIE